LEKSFETPGSEDTGGNISVISSLTATFCPRV